MAKASPKKVVLAYSGGLDTSIILKWLQTTYGCEVVTFTADLGQGEELEPARKKALLLGIKPENIFIEDLREEFVRDYVFPMFRANTRLRGPVSARHLDRAAADRQEADRDRREGRRRRRRAWRHRQGQRPGALRAHLLRAQAGRDRDRAVAGMGPDLAQQADRVRREAPDSDRQGQARRGAVLGRRQPAARLVRRQGAGRPGAGSAGLRLFAHASIRKRRRTSRPSSRSISSAATRSRSTARSCRRRRCSPSSTSSASANGIGRLDLVENRFVGMKSRGMYETPGGTILLAAHRGIESDHARPRRRASQGRADAEICRADL